MHILQYYSCSTLVSVVNMATADGLAPFWYQYICKGHDDTGQLWIISGVPAHVKQFFFIMM